MSKIIKSKKLISNDKCLITNESLSNIIDNKTDFVIKLNCKHCFSYKSFITSYIINNLSEYSHNKCPYCFSNIKNIPIVINKYLKD